MKLSATLKAIQSTSILSRWSQGNQLKTMRDFAQNFKFAQNITLERRLAQKRGVQCTRHSLTQNYRNMQPSKMIYNHRRHFMDPTNSNSEEEQPSTHDDAEFEEEQNRQAGGQRSSYRRMVSSKNILIVAGPNGAGKTTFARNYLLNEADDPTFINADMIAEGLNPFQPERSAFAAGRIMLRMIDEYVRRGESFAFVTTKKLSQNTGGCSIHRLTCANKTD